MTDKQFESVMSHEIMVCLKKSECRLEGDVSQFRPDAEGCHAGLGKHLSILSLGAFHAIPPMMAAMPYF
jgi:hypothetical protein